MIDSVKDIKTEETRAQIACMLNEVWHSRLPKLHWSNVVRSGDYVCYVFKYQEAIVGTSIWSSPVSRILAKDKNKLELRRMALSNVCPKNTASFVISVMTKKIKDKFKNVKTLISYHDTAVHLGTIYKAANWKKVNVSNGGQWSRQTRNRSKVQSDSKKIRWEYQI